MTTKAAVTKVAQETVSVSANGRKTRSVQPDYKPIPWKDLQTSPTNPRRRIDEKTIESLAASIRTQGVLEPLIVRQKENKWEIVCGERRYRAARIAGMTELPCLVRELSDEQVLDIQIHENLHREDIHPMDEAYGYQFLKEKLGCDVRELSLRVGKSEGYVLNRLKLNSLIKEAQKDIEDNYLPLVYALEIAKYSAEIQKHIYGELYRKQGKYQGNNYVMVPIKGEMVPFRSFLDWINTNIHRRLSKAPFDTKATNLRDDGLACAKCPERTGAVVSLFEPNQIGKKDACLNPGCFIMKAQNHIDVRRKELAELGNIEPSEVPIVRSFSYTNGKDYLGSESAIVVGDVRGANKKKCRNTISGIDIESDNYGKPVQVCLKTTRCKIHWPEAITSSNGNAPKGRSSEAEVAERLESHRTRREEIWNAKVAEAVRIRVFKQAAEKFEKKFRITDVGTDFLPQLISRFWRMTGSGDSNNLNAVVKTLVAEWSSKTAKDNGINLSDFHAGAEYVKKLRREIQFRILFVLVHCNKGAIGYVNGYSSQKEVKELAVEFDLDYALIDAEVRLELSAKKHKAEHETYLAAVRAKDKKATIPWLFSEKWKARD